MSLQKDSQQSDLLRQPSCPNCSKPMWLARVEPYKADCHKRTFECPVCLSEESTVVDCGRRAAFDSLDMPLPVRADIEQGLGFRRGLLALDRERTVGELDVDVIDVHPGQLSGDLVGSARINDVDAAPSPSPARPARTARSQTSSGRMGGAKRQCRVPPKSWSIWRFRLSNGRHSAGTPGRSTLFSSVRTGNFVAVSAITTLPSWSCQRSGWRDQAIRIRMCPC